MNENYTNSVIKTLATTQSVGNTSVNATVIGTLEVEQVKGKIISHENDDKTYSVSELIINNLTLELGGLRSDEIRIDSNYTIKTMRNIQPYYLINNQNIMVGNATFNNVCRFAYPVAGVYYTQAFNCVINSLRSDSKILFGRVRPASFSNITQVIGQGEYYQQLVIFDDTNVSSCAETYYVNPDLSIVTNELLDCIIGNNTHRRIDKTIQVIQEYVYGIPKCPINNVKTGSATFLCKCKLEVANVVMGRLYYLDSNKNTISYENIVLPTTPTVDTYTEQTSNAVTIPANTAYIDFSPVRRGIYYSIKMN